MYTTCTVQYQYVLSCRYTKEDADPCQRQQFKKDRIDTKDKVIAVKMRYIHVYHYDDDSTLHT